MYLEVELAGFATRLHEIREKNRLTGYPQDSGLTVELSLTETGRAMRAVS